MVTWAEVGTEKGGLSSRGGVVAGSYLVVDRVRYGDSSQQLLLVETRELDSRVESSSAGNGARGSSKLKTFGRVCGQAAPSRRQVPGIILTLLELWWPIRGPMCGNAGLRLVHGPWAIDCFIVAARDVWHTLRRAIRGHPGGGGAWGKRGGAEWGVGGKQIR